jgi:tight adherence protein B
VTPALLASLSSIVAVATLAAASTSLIRARTLARAGHREGVIEVDRRRAKHALVAVGSIVALVVADRLAGLAGAAAVLAGAVVAPMIIRRRRDVRRTNAVQEQLAEAISVIASGLRAGRSLVQAFGLAATEVAEPLGLTFGRLVERVTLGDPLDEALLAWRDDVSGADARLAAGVFRLHRRTGGALAVTLENLAETLRARRSAIREVRSLTAQARLSAAILGLLPIGFFLFLSIVAREDLQAAYETSIGTTVIVVGFALQGLAYLWIRRLLRVEP